MLELRPATIEDAPAAAAVITAVNPDEPEDPDVEAWRWQNTPSVELVERLLVEDRGRLAGYATRGHARWPPAATGGKRFGRVSLLLLPEAEDEAAYDHLLGELETWTREEGAQHVASWAREDQDFYRRGLERNGYRFDRLQKSWDLDLTAHRERLLAEREQTRRNARTQRIELKPLAEVDDPERMRKLYDLEVVTEADVPHTVPWPTPTYDDYAKIATRYDIRPDRWWTAWSGDRLVALSYLKYPRIGNVWTGYTCCHPEFRGRGIARAVKMETLGQAIELGIANVRTDNDEQNAPMLHINETLGYRRIPGHSTYLKDL